MTVRPLRLEDWPAVDGMLARLHQAHLAARPDIFALAEHVYSREQFAALLADSLHICRVADVEGSAVGVCLATLKASAQTGVLAAYMDALFVLPEMRRQGGVKALVRGIMRAARDAGAQRLDLMVWAFNEEAMAFYRAMGLTPQRTMLEISLAEEARA